MSSICQEDINSLTKLIPPKRGWLPGVNIKWVQKHSSFVSATIKENCICEGSFQSTIKDIM